MLRLEPNDSGVLPCTCGAYPILVEAEVDGGTPPMGYVCLKCPACMRPRRGRTYPDTERIALEAWNTATVNEHLLAGLIDEQEAARIRKEVELWA